MRVGALVCAAVLLAGCMSDEDGREQAATTAAAAQESRAAGNGFDAIPDVVARLQPSIVAVVVRGAQGAGEGSGVITEDGVVTNNHVVEGAEDVFVTLASGERIPATIRATDPLTDLALLETDRDDLPPATLAGELPRVGELAIAMGNPLGFEQTVTQGIVSGLHRTLPGGGGGALVDLIQTDAAISPGNSGGALVNAAGEVIGINVAYIPPQVGSVSIGFAIPAPTASDVIADLLDDGKVEHPYLGVVPVQVTPDVAERLGVETGALVLDVVPGSPAARAGLRRGDVIVAMDGNRTETVEELLTEIRRHDPGDRVTLTFVRDGREREVELTLGSR